MTRLAYYLDVTIREAGYSISWYSAEILGIAHNFAVESATKRILDDYVTAKEAHDAQRPLGRVLYVPDFVAALERTVTARHPHVQLQRCEAVCSAWAAHLEEILHMWDEPAQEEPVSP